MPPSTLKRCQLGTIYGPYHTPLSPFSTVKGEKQLLISAACCAAVVVVVAVDDAVSGMMC